MANLAREGGCSPSQVADAVTARSPLQV